MVSSSLKGNADIFVFPPVLFPHSPRRQLRAGAELHPVRHVLPKQRDRLSGNGGWHAGRLRPGRLCFSILRWPGRDLVFRLVLATIMLPFPVVMVPQYLIFRNLGWLGTLLPLMVPPFLGAFITPYFASSLAIFLLRQFYARSAARPDRRRRIDGPATGACSGTSSCRSRRAAS